MGDVGVRYVAVHAVAECPAGGDVGALKAAVAAALGCVGPDGGAPDTGCPVVLFGSTVTEDVGDAVGWLREAWRPADDVPDEVELRRGFRAVVDALDDLSPVAARALDEETNAAVVAGLGEPPGTVPLRWVESWLAMFRQQVEFCDRRLAALQLAGAGTPHAVRVGIAERAALRRERDVWRTAADVLAAGEWRRP